MNQSNKGPSLLVDALRAEIKGLFREVLREEMAGQNGNQEPKLLYNMKEAASLLTVPETWLGRAARQGIVPCVRMGRYVRFTANNLEAYIEKLRNETGPDMGAKRGSKRKRETD